MGASASTVAPSRLSVLEANYVAAVDAATAARKARREAEIAQYVADLQSFGQGAAWQKWLVRHGYQ